MQMGSNLLNGHESQDPAKTHETMHKVSYN